MRMECPPLAQSGRCLFSDIYPIIHRLASIKPKLNQTLSEDPTISSSNIARQHRLQYRDAQTGLTEEHHPVTLPACLRAAPLAHFTLPIYMTFTFLWNSRSSSAEYARIINPLAFFISLSSPYNDVVINKKRIEIKNISVSDSCKEVS